MANLAISQRIIGKSSLNNNQSSTKATPWYRLAHVTKAIHHCTALFSEINVENVMIVTFAVSLSEYYTLSKWPNPWLTWLKF